MREIWNAYFDDLSNINFLKLDFKFSTLDPIGTLSVRYNLDVSGISIKLGKILYYNHFVKLNLIERYSEEVMNEISNLVENIEKVEGLSISHIKPLLTGNLEQLKRNCGLNHWKVRFLEEMLQSTFLESVVDIIVSNIT